MFLCLVRRPPPGPGSNWSDLEVAGKTTKQPEDQSAAPSPVLRADDLFQLEIPRESACRTGKAQDGDGWWALLQPGGRYFWTARQLV